MSIGTFTTLLLGYKSAEKLLQMGKIQATYDAVAKLDDIYIMRYHMYLTIYNDKRSKGKGK